MARDILSEYGRDADKPQAPRATQGGVPAFRDVMDYQPPVGPIGIDRNSVGLGGANLGNCGTQGPKPSTGDGSGGAPGIVRIGGENKGEEGSQHG